MIHIDVLAHKFLIRIKYWVIIIILIGFEITIKKNDPNRHKHSVVNFGRD